MRRRRSTFPRYVRPKRLSNKQLAYFFEIPTWAKKAGCTVESKALGTDLALAVEEAEGVLLKQFDSWRTGGASDMTPVRATVGSFDWLVKTFKESRKYTEIDDDTKRTYDQGLALAANHVRKSGVRFGETMLSSIDTESADKLYEKLKVVREKVKQQNDAGESIEVDIERTRLATANASMRSCRRAWNVVHRLKPKIVPAANPFSRMGLKTDQKETPAASYDELLIFMAHNDAPAVDRASLSTAALVAWEWAQRPEHIFGKFEAVHYRPKDRPNQVLVVHPKNGANVWIPLFDPDSGVPLYPELMARLDAIKRNRISGLMIVRDWKDEDAGVPVPWITEAGDLSYMRHETRRLMDKAGLGRELSFRSFRHGGITEIFDSDATEEEGRAITGHKSPAVLPSYSKRTMRRVANVAHKRRKTRTKGGHLSE